MKTIKLKSIFYLLAIIQFSSCSSVKVYSDLDRSEDFTLFKTFEFYGWANNSDQVLTRFDKERIEAAFVEEARKRGLTGVKENGDVIFIVYSGCSKNPKNSKYYHYRNGGYEYQS